MIFAEDPGVPGAVYIAIGSVITTLIGGLVAAAIQIMRTRHGQKTANRRETLKEAFQVIDQLRKDRDEDREEMDKLQEKASKAVDNEAICQRRLARAETRIEALEEAMEKAGIRFRPWNAAGPESGSGHHRPVKDGDPPSPAGGT